MDGFIGEIRMFAPNFAPNMWAFCQGQVLNISSNVSLYFIVGNTFGGNGTTNFALPDLRGRTGIGTGSGPGLSTYTLGQKTGSTTNALTAGQFPAHNHTLNGPIQMNICTLAGSTDTPNGNYFAVDGTKRFDEQNDGLTMVPLNITLGATGNTTPAAFGNVMPYLAINYIICLNGNFPSRT